MKRLSLVQIITLFVMVMLIGMTLIGSYIIYQSHRQIQDYFVRQADLSVMQFREELAAPVWLRKMDYLAASLQTFKNLPDVAFVRLNDAEGNRLLSNGDATYDSLLLSMSNRNIGRWDSDSLIIISNDISYNEETQGRLMVGFSKQKIREAYAGSLRKVLFLGGGMAVLMLFLGLLIAYASVSPITAATEEFANHRLEIAGMSIRLQEKGSRETVEMARAFNTLAESMEEKFTLLYNQPPELQRYFAENPVPMLITDPYWNIRSVNRTAMALLERKEASITGRSLEELLPSQDIDKLVKEVWRNHEQPQTLTVSITLGEGEKKKELALSTVGLKENGGSPDSFLVVLSDLSPEILRETDFNTQLKRLKKIQHAIAQKYKHLKLNYEKQQQYLQRLIRLIRAAEKIVVLEQSESIMNTLIFEGTQLLGGREAAIYLWQQDHRMLVPYPSSYPDRPQEQRLPLKDSKGIIWNTFHSRQTQFIDSYHPASYRELGLLDDQRVALMAVPLVLSEKPFGVVVFWRTQENFFTNEDEQFISLLIHSAVVALDRCDLNRQPVMPPEARSSMEARWEISSQEAFQQQKMESLEILVGGIAHDFNNILGIIMPNVDLLRIKFGKYPQVLKRVTAIQAAIDRATELTRQLVSFTRSDALSIKRVSPNRILERVVSMLQRAFGEIFKIELVLDPKVPLIEADITRLSQALINLAMNARDAMPRGGKITIRTSVESYLPPGENGPSRKYVCISVEDKGVGIPEENLLKVFDPFFTTKPPRQGVGMGLAVVHGIVKSHQGYITVTSRVNKGSVFQIFLVPVVQVQPEKVAKRPVQPQAQGAAKLHEAVLIVDDEDMVRESLKELLEYLGYTVLEASGGREALKLVKERGEDIKAAIVDFAMPGMNGIETIQAIQQLQPDMKIILSSGYTEQEKSVHQKSGISAFLRKPFHLGSVSEKMGKVFQKTASI